MAQTLFTAAMAVRPTDVPNIRQAVPFFGVKDIEASLRFYVDGLGFTMTRALGSGGTDPLVLA